MPPRRSSVGAGAGLDNPDDPPSGDSDDDYAASRTTPAKGRGSGRARGTRGRGRGAGRARGRGRGGANAARSASKVEDDEEVDELEDDRSDSDSGEASSARAPRPVSPELGVPAAPPEQAENGVPAALVRSSSLSLLSSPASSRASVPPPPQSRLSPAQQEDPNTPVKPQPSPSLLNGSARRTLLGEDGDVAFASPSSVGTVRRPAAAASTHDPTADSLSELDTDISDVDDLAAPASSQEPRASTSASSTPAPLDYDSSTTSAKKKRGRPPGSRNKQHKQPISRAQRAAAAAASVAPAVAPTKVVRNGGASKGGDGAASGSGSGSTPRATRANVTLPPGYIEGVTSSRWPRAQGKGESESAAEGTDGTPMVESGMDDEDELEEEDVKPRLVATPKKADKKGKGRAVVLKDEEEGEEEVDELMDEASTVAMSRETSLDGPPTPVQPPVGKGGPGRPKGKGKRGKKEKVMPEPVERAKRRKLEPDEQAVGRAAAREAARLKFLDQLDDERRLVEERTHPLLGFTYRQLEEEKAQKLAQLRMYQEEREKELERLADTRVRASWRQWSDRKDALRSKLYFENHKSLKDLIAEEKVFPFFREHPLFTNTHDLPPAPHFRGPIRDPSFVPRSLIHAGHYVEPPPLNPVLDHNSWRLSASEIEADLALFFDIDDEPYQAAAAPPAPGPPAGVGMYPYPSPYYYDPAAPPSLVGAYGIPPIPGYPPSGMPPAPYYPPPHHTASGPYGAPPPAHAAPPSAPSSRSAPLREQRAPAPAHQQQQHPAQRSPPVSRKPAPAPPPAASPKTVKPAPVPSSKPAPAPAPVKLPSMNGFSATAPTFPSRPPPAPLPSQGHSSSHPHSSSHSHSHQHSHSHSSAHSHSHSHSHQHHHHRSQSSHTAASPPIPSMSASSSAIPPAQKPTLPSLMAPSFPASSAPRFPSVAGYSVPAAATTATNGHAHTHSHSHSHAHSHSHSQSHSHGQSHPHSRPPSHPPSRSSLPPHAPSPASHTPSAAPAPPTLPSLSQPRISPSLSAPKLPSLTHRSPPGAGPPPSASPPVPGSAPALNLPSLFSGNTAVPGAASLAGSRSPFGLGGMLNGGGGGGGMAPGLSLGFGPATGLPLPSWLNPLPKPSVGVAPSPQGGAGGGEAAAKKQDGGGGVKLPSLNQPPLGQPQHQHQPPRPYWAQ